MRTALWSMFDTLRVIRPRLVVLPNCAMRFDAGAACIVWLLSPTNILLATRRTQIAVLNELACDRSAINETHCIEESSTVLDSFQAPLGNALSRSSLRAVSTRRIHVMTANTRTR